MYCAGIIYHGNMSPPNTALGNILVLTLQIFKALALNCVIRLLLLLRVCCE